MVYQKPFSTQEGVGVFSSRGIHGKYHEISNSRINGAELRANHVTSVPLSLNWENTVL